MHNKFSNNNNAFNVVILIVLGAAFTVYLQIAVRVLSLSIFMIIYRCIS